MYCFRCSLVSSNSSSILEIFNFNSFLFFSSVFIIGFCNGDGCCVDPLVAGYVSFLGCAPFNRPGRVIGWRCVGMWCMLTQTTRVK